MDIIHLIENLNIPAELIVFIIAMLPIFEIRGALPIAIGFYKMSIWKAFLISLIGNLLPAIFIILFFEYLMRFLERKKSWLYRFLHRFSKEIKHRHNSRYNLLGDLFLISFVALPLPFTGAWTASLAAVVFEIPYKQAIFSIFLGIMIAAIIVYATIIGVSFI